MKISTGIACKYFMVEMVGCAEKVLWCMKLYSVLSTVSYRLKCSVSSEQRNNGSSAQYSGVAATPAAFREQLDGSDKRVPFKYL